MIKAAHLRMAAQYAAGRNIEPTSPDGDEYIADFLNTKVLDIPPARTGGDNMIQAAHLRMAAQSAAGRNIEPTSPDGDEYIADFLNTKVLGMPQDEKLKQLQQISNEILGEVWWATKRFNPLNSPHEAEGVIREEFEEFWDEVKKYNPRKGRDTRPAMRAELVQLAAMAMRAILDVIDNGKHYEEQPCSQGTTPSTTPTSN